MYHPVAEYVTQVIKNELNMFDLQPPRKKEDETHIPR